MTDTLTHNVSLTDTAREKVKALIDAEGNDELRLRIDVKTGHFATEAEAQVFLDDLPDRARDFVALVSAGIAAESEIGVVQRVLLQTTTASAQ